MVENKTSKQIEDEKVVGDVMEKIARQYEDFLVVFEDTDKYHYLRMVLEEMGYEDGIKTIQKIKSALELTKNVAEQFNRFV